MKIVTPKKQLDKHLVSLLDINSIDAERYRKLRQSVEEYCRKLSDEGHKGGKIIAITSALSGDGKTLTSINLAGALAQDPEAKILLVELDIRQRRSNIRHYLGLKDFNEPGIVDRIQGKSKTWLPEDFIYNIERFNLHLMPSGSMVELPYEILKSSELGDVFQQAREHYDVIIVDTAPIVMTPDAKLISRWVDGFLIVVAANSTPKNMLEEALNSMDGEKVIGLVFNGFDGGAAAKKYGGYS